MSDTHSIEGLIYRYISDHALREGAQLPRPSEFAEALQCDTQTLVAALEVVRRRGVIAEGPQDHWVIQLPPVVRDQESLSFSHSAGVHGEKMDRELLEVASRGPRDDPEDSFTTELERKAHQVLALGKGDPFVVINRAAFLHRDGYDARDRRVIHRTFLDPKRFPETFLEAHDFSKESLVRIYNGYGYTIERRLDTMRARAAALPERIYLRIDMGQPVLDLEQRTMARPPDGSDPILLEYLRATYWNISFEFER